MLEAPVHQKRESWEVRGLEWAKFNASYGEVSDFLAISCKLDIANLNFIRAYWPSLLRYTRVVWGLSLALPRLLATPCNIGTTWTPLTIVACPFRRDFVFSRSSASLHRRVSPAASPRPIVLKFAFHLRRLAVGVRPLSLVFKGPLASIAIPCLATCHQELVRAFLDALTYRSSLATAAPNCKFSKLGFYSVFEWIVSSETSQDQRRELLPLVNLWRESYYPFTYLYSIDTTGFLNNLKPRAWRHFRVLRGNKNRHCYHL